MSRVAYLENGVVTNVALGDEAFATATGGIFTTEPVAKGWLFSGGAFVAPEPPEPPGPKRTGLTQGQFRLLFTFEERQGEAAFKRAAEAAALNGTATNEQLVYLTMRDDFDNAGSINLTDASTLAALDFYVAFGLLTQARATQVAAGLPPE